jgi:hypothetical protein
VAGIRYLVDNDRKPYVWRTTDYGATWTKIVNGIPDNDFVRAVREDPKRPGLLYAGSESTVYVSWDDGANWQKLGLNLPVTQVSDIRVEENDLVIATHGRSFWIMYDIGPIRQLSPQIAQAAVHLFDPTDPVRDVDVGAQVVYYLKDDVDSLTLEFLDGSGNLIQSFTGTKQQEQERRAAPQEEEFEFFGGGAARRPSTKAGSRAFTWNLRYPGYTEFEGRIFWAAGNNGPVAVPGRYQVRLKTGSVVQSQEFEVKLDPRLQGQVTIAQLQERFDFAARIRDRVSDANEGVIRIRTIKKAVDDRVKQANDPALTRQADLVKTRLGAVEEEIYQVRNRSSQDPLNYPIKLNNKLAALIGVVESAEAPPTAQSYAVFQHLDSLLQRQLNLLETVIQTDVAQLNQLLRGKNLEPINTDKPRRDVAATSEER